MQPEEVRREVSPSTLGSGSELPRTANRRPDDISENHSPKEKPDRSHKELVSDSSIQDRVIDEQLPRNVPKPDSRERSEEQTHDDQKRSEDAAAAAKELHKRNEDAIAAAKERYLARKRAKKAQ